MTDVTIPDLVDYPQFLSFSEYGSLFKNILCYVIEPYELVGYSVYVGFRNGYSLVRVGDFESNMIGCDDYIIKYIDILIEITKSIGINDSIYYFSKNNGSLVLVDMMLSANKFAGPGMLRDIFGKVFKTQNVIDICQINEETTNKYNTKVVKPSSFKYIIDKNTIRPQYGLVK
jgi:hypothetical protein